ncbi:unnamed protein product [Hyaloperonospora brassicae]|uniref:RxLR effector candidate protein n=1 Tax=Hyaloperonospora brassicae TaxID=162125 RepID=A0AAV0T5T0_HYABA|nr:unnamed protein product [Hyaloperonospora brassicae]
MQQLPPFRPSLRRAMCVVLFAIEQTRRVLIAAISPRDDARERPVIEVVTKDVRTADIFYILEVIGGEDEIVLDEPASWWKDAVIDEFSRQDLLLLALIAICALRVLLFAMKVTWNLIRWPVQWYSKLRIEADEDHERADTSSESVRKQLAIIRFCHLQFALATEKLKREIREDKSEDTHDVVALLAIRQDNEATEVTLAEILATLRSIQKMDIDFRLSEVEEHLASIRQHVEDEEAIDCRLSEAWTRLQETYALFLQLQTTAARGRTHRKTGQWQQHRRHHEQCPQEVSARRPRRLSSREDMADEVLHELQELTKELPQGFTADMFTSLGKVMHEQVARSKRD